MKKKTLWISAAIAVVVASPGVSALAASVTTPAPAATSAAGDHAFDGRGGHGKGEKGDHGKGRGHEGFLGGAKNSAHSEEYLTLLTEKYAPDQTAAVTAAFDEKASLEKQLTDLKDASKTTMEQKRADEKAKVDAIKAKVTSGELTQAQADEQIKALRDANRPAKQEATAEQIAQRDAEKALRDSFNTAVQTVVDGGSADELKQILPKLVDNLKVENKELSDRLAQLKTQVAAG
jgi:hypothetical protein